MKLLRKLRFNRFPALHITLLILVSLPTSASTASPELVADDIRIFHRGWSTWVGLYYEYEHLVDRLPEPVKQSEDEVMTPFVGGMIYLEYEDTEITVFYVNNRVRRVLTRSQEAVTPRGIVIGSGQNSVIFAYGDPWRIVETEDHEIYQYRTRTTADPFSWNWMVLSFGFNKEGRVSFIELSYLSSTVP